MARQSLPNLQFQTVTEPDGDYTQKLQKIAVLKSRDCPLTSVEVDFLQKATPNQASFKVLSPFLRSVSGLSRSILPKKNSIDLVTENKSR